MEEEKYQKELFEFEKPKKSFPDFGRIFTRTNFAIAVTMERLIFISIGIIMLVVIVYALGIEKGKSLGKLSAIAVSKPLEKVAPSAIVTGEVKTTAQVKVVPQPMPIKAQAIQTETKIPEPGKPYTIVAVTFMRKDTAAQEMNHLKKEGFDAFVVQSDSYFLVCIGSYADKESVQSKKSLGKVRQFYKDAYFKLK